jgi:type IV pilus assembly protein PilX
MLKSNSSAVRMRPMPRRQTGVVLIIALIVLVAMTLTAVSLVRSVDTNNVIAGNLAFQQAALHSADRGIEAALGWLKDCNITHANCQRDSLGQDDSTNGYTAAGNNSIPNTNESWDAYWWRALKNHAVEMAEDGAKNRVFYVIDRLCNSPGPSDNTICTSSPVVSTVDDNDHNPGLPWLKAGSGVYYRITVRVAGPRNTASYVQAVVSM